MMKGSISLRMSPWKVVMAPPHGTFQIRATSRAEHPTPLAASDCVGTREADDVAFPVRYNDSNRHSCNSFPLAATVRGNKREDGDNRSHKFKYGRDQVGRERGLREGRLR